ncbi:DNA-binding pseudobarrel domain-containing protein [Tanacetum coccineum]
MNQKSHDGVIRSLDSMVKALTREVEGRASRTKIGECKEEIEEIEDAVAHRGPAPHEVKPSELPIVSFYVAPYEPSITFPRHLKQHSEEALVHKTMESLKRIKEQVTKSIPKGIVENLLIKIDKLIFLVDFVILDMVEDLRIPIVLGRPLLAMTHAKVDVLRKLISLEVGNQKKIETVKEPNRKRDIDLSLVVKQKVHWCRAIRQQRGYGHGFWASCDPYDDQCDGGDLDDNTENKCYWGCLNDDKRLDVAMGRNEVQRLGKSKPWEGRKKELTLDVVLDKLDDDWFTGTINDEDDLDRIFDYLELKSHDDFIDINNEAYKGRMCKLLGMTYKKPSSILIKKVEVTRNLCVGNKRILNCYYCWFKLQLLVGVTAAAQD